MSDIIEILKDVIVNPQQPLSERDRAAAVLKFYVAKEKQHLGESESERRRNGVADNPKVIELDRVVAQMLACADVRALWNQPDKFTIETVTGEDGSTRQNVIRVKEAVTEPDPVLPGFTPAIGCRIGVLLVVLCGAGLGPTFHTVSASVTHALRDGGQSTRQDSHAR